MGHWEWVGSGDSGDCFSPKTQCDGEKVNGETSNWCSFPLVCAPAAFLTVRRERTPGTTLELSWKPVGLDKGRVRVWGMNGGQSRGDCAYGGGDPDYDSAVCHWIISEAFSTKTKSGSWGERKLRHYNDLWPCT